MDELQREIEEVFEDFLATDPDEAEIYILGAIQRAALAGQVPCTARDEICYHEGCGPCFGGVCLFWRHPMFAGQDLYDEDE